MSSPTKHTWLLLCGALALSACEESSATGARKPDSAVDDEPDAAVDSPSDGTDDAGAANDDAGAQPSDDAGDAPVPSDCFTDPKTYLEIINACTDAEKLDKKPTLPLLLADGGLPDLP